MEPRKERVVITVMGANKPGILAGIATSIAEAGANVEDVSQKILQDYFALMMIVDITSANCSFEDFQNRVTTVAERLSGKAFIQHEDVFKFQHRL